MIIYTYILLAVVVAYFLTGKIKDGKLNEWYTLLFWLIMTIIEFIQRFNPNDSNILILGNFFGSLGYCFVTFMVALVVTRIGTSKVKKQKDNYLVSATEMFNENSIIPKELEYVPKKGERFIVIGESRLKELLEDNLIQKKYVLRYDIDTIKVNEIYSNKLLTGKQKIEINSKKNKYSYNELKNYIYNLLNKSNKDGVPSNKDKEDVTSNENKEDTFKTNLIKDEADKFEEIKKYKDLLDNGIITETEFEKKKKDLLDL